ncbi:MAG: hypothetical protein R6T91_02880 [Bacteroidales bacterium]
MSTIQIHKAEKITPRVQIEVPASKSISNRLLMLKAISGNQIRINNLSTADDTTLLNDILTNYQSTKSSHLTFNCDNAGTVMRFLTAYFSFQPATVQLTASEAMKQRPISPLVTALREMGAKIEYMEKHGFPPLKVYGQKTATASPVKMDSTISSQFFSALMLLAPQTGLILELPNTLVSHSYVEMTLAIMDKLKIDYHLQGQNIHIPKQSIDKQTIACEQDWSSAAPWYVLTSLMPSGYTLAINRLPIKSIQGDRKLVQLFRHFGVKTIPDKTGVILLKTNNINLSPLRLNISTIPDTAPYLIIAGLFQKRAIQIHGAGHLRYKESDRLFVMQSELKKAGYPIHIDKNHTIEIAKSSIKKLQHSITVDTHNDHRIAMAFAPLAAYLPQISLLSGEAVSKSYPAFWDEFRKCGFTVKKHPLSTSSC